MAQDWVGGQRWVYGLKNAWFVQKTAVGARRCMKVFIQSLELLTVIENT